MEAAILDFFATGVFFDDLEVDAFFFGIVTIIALTDFDLPDWNTGRRLVVLCCCVTGLRCALLRLALRVLRCVTHWWDFVARCWAARHKMLVLRSRDGARCCATRAGAYVAHWWFALRCGAGSTHCCVRVVLCARASFGLRCGACSLLVLHARGCVVDLLHCAEADSHCCWLRCIALRARDKCDARW